MDLMKPVVSNVRSCSTGCTQFLAGLLFFLMLPIDSLLRVNVQNQVKMTLSQLLSNDLGRVVVAVLFLAIWMTKDVMLLLLYLCALKKIGLY